MKSNIIFNLIFTYKIYFSSINPLQFKYSSNIKIFCFSNFNSIWNINNNIKYSISSSIRTLDYYETNNKRNEDFGNLLQINTQIQKLILRGNWNLYINDIPTSIKSLHLLNSQEYISLEYLTFIQKLEIGIHYSEDKNIEMKIDNILSTLPNSITELSIYFNDYNLSSKI